MFLEVLGKTANVTEAARSAGIGRMTAYDWRSADEAFAKAWDDALEVSVDALEAEARRRAVEGWEEPVFQGGKDVGTIRRYSDRMLEILLKGHRPKFRENQRIEVSGPNGGPVVTVVDLVRGLTPPTPKP